MRVGVNSEYSVAEIEGVKTKESYLVDKKMTNKWLALRLGGKKFESKMMRIVLDSSVHRLVIPFPPFLLYHFHNSISRWRNIATDNVPTKVLLQHHHSTSLPYKIVFAIFEDYSSWIESLGI